MKIEDVCVQVVIRRGTKIKGVIELNGSQLKE